MIGLIGKKLGMTQIPLKSGEMAACTVVEAGPCFVLGIRSEETNGYSAVQLCFGDVKKKRLPNPVVGEFVKVFQEDRETYPAQ